MLSVPQKDRNKPITDENDINFVGDPEVSIPEKGSNTAPFIIAIGVLGFLVVFFIVVAIIFFVLWKNARSAISDELGKQN